MWLVVWDESISFQFSRGVGMESLILWGTYTIVCLEPSAVVKQNNQEGSHHIIGTEKGM